jgi:hypothetical protein
MNRTRLSFAPLLLPSLCAALLTGCGKDPKPSETPTVTDGGDGGATSDGGDSDEPFVPDVPQDPDPAEINAARHAYLMGNYSEAVETLEPLYADLKSRSQYRAGGLAGGWLAVAHAQMVYENADEPSQHAVAMADLTKDPEVVAVGKLSRGAFFLSQSDFAAARENLDAAVAAKVDGVVGAVANLLHAEAMISSAFDGGDTLVNPSDLDIALTSYEAAAAIAKGSEDADILLGRIHEGLAAVGKYKRDNDILCVNAFASIDHYKAAGAADLSDIPNKLATDARCEPPK